MTRSLLAFLLACVCATTTFAVGAREVQRLSAGDAGCPADLAAAKAEAEDKQEDAPARAAKPATAPVRRQPGVRGSDPAPAGQRLQAPRWHSFLPGMFR